jgi:hypothetical protein
MVCATGAWQCMGGGVVGDDPKLGLETHTCPKGCL